MAARKKMAIVSDGIDAAFLSRDFGTSGWQLPDNTTPICGAPGRGITQYLILQCMSLLLTRFGSRGCIAAVEKTLFSAAHRDAEKP
jgi:hypothetical protein